MLYRHKRTGAVIDVDSVASGSWEPIKAPGEPDGAATPEKPKKMTASKGGKTK